MRNLLNFLGNQAPAVAVYAVLTFILSATLAYFVVRDFKRPSSLSLPSSHLSQQAKTQPGQLGDQ
jgi:hypothetical protein